MPLLSDSQEAESLDTESRYLWAANLSFSAAFIAGGVKGFFAFLGAERSIVSLVYFAAEVRIWFVAWRRTDADPERRLPE